MKHTMKSTSRTSTLVIALTIAALASPTLAHAKRLGGGFYRPVMLGLNIPTQQTD